MLRYVMTCSVMLCYGMLCSVMLWYALFCQVLSCVGECARQESRGILGGPGDLAAAVCRVGGSAGLFLKSNDPSLSGGEKAKGPLHPVLRDWLHLARGPRPNHNTILTRNERGTYIGKRALLERGGHGA